jgi:hypothetical protein
MAERQIVFYACQDFQRLPAFDRLAAVRGINDLSDADWRVQDYETEMGVIVDRVGDARTSTRLRFIRIREDSPHVLTAARQLSLLAPPEGEFSEFTWAVIWPDNYMAAVSSRDAPGHRRLAVYFKETSGQRTDIVNLYQPDVVQRLNEIKRRLRSVDIRVQTSRLEQMEADERTRGFAQLLRAGTGTTDAAQIELKLSVGRDPEATLSDDLGQETVDVARQAELLERLVVKGRDHDGVIQEIDMKKERLTVPVDVGPTASDQYIYNEIEHARALIERDYNSLDRGARGH